MHDIIHTAKKCEWDYVSHGPNTYTIVCTLLIVLFTVFLELVVHGNIDCCNTIKDGDENMTDSSPHAAVPESLLPKIVDEQPRAHTVDVPSNDTSQASTGDQDPDSTQSKQPPQPGCYAGCPPKPSPNVRANRLIAAIFLYAVVLTAFIMRLNNIINPYIRPECRRFVWNGPGSIPGPNWWAVVFLNILPFIAASFSLFRTVVDCFLVRWGKSLAYGGPTREDACTWPPCMPFFLLLGVIQLLVKGLLAWPIALMMGRPMSSVWPAQGAAIRGREDIEMQGEESRRLIDDVDGEAEVRDGRSDGPPAYDEAVMEGPQGRVDEAPPAHSPEV